MDFTLVGSVLTAIRDMCDTQQSLRYSIAVHRLLGVIQGTLLVKAETFYMWRFATFVWITTWGKRTLRNIGSRNMHQTYEILIIANVRRLRFILVGVVGWLNRILPCFHFIMLMIRDVDTIWKRDLFLSGNQV